MATDYSKSEPTQMCICPRGSAGGSWTALLVRVRPDRMAGVPSTKRHLEKSGTHQVVNHFKAVISKRF